MSAPTVLLAVCGTLACGALPAAQSAAGGVALGAPESNDSMIFLASTDAGPIVIDLGWVGGPEALARGLRASGWEPADVAGVFLTHAHRDHIGAWRLVADAPFHLARPEVPLLTGAEPPPGPLDRLGDRLWPADRPEPGRLDLRPFSADTVFPLGTDTVRAFIVPGHTGGSAAYLLRGVLFIGDAAAPRLPGGLGPPAGAYSLDPTAGRAALIRLLDRLEERDVRFVCTAHARCYPYDEARGSLREAG